MYVVNTDKVNTMDTYYLDGCKDKEPEIVFFDKIFGSAMVLIDLDNKLQEELAYHLQTEEGLNEDISDYNEDSSKLKESYKNIINYINTELKRLEQITIFENNTKIYEAAIQLFKIYSLELTKAIPIVIEIIEKEEPEEDDSEKLNHYYPQMQKKLDTELDNFYEKVHEYANKYNIETE